MKAKVSLIALMGLLVIGFTSCKKSEPAADFTFSPAAVNVEPGKTAEVTITATGNIDGQPAWSIDNEKVATIAPKEQSMVTYVVTGVEEGTANITVAWGSITKSIPVTVKKAEIKTPDVQGEAGKYTLAFRAPSATACYDKISIYMFGDFQGNDPAAEAPVATKIEQAGFDNWYKIVFESADATQAAGKICPASVDGTRSWNCQGSKYVLIKGNGEIIDDYGTQNKIKFADTSLGDVVYVDVEGWASDPCVAPFPGGTAEFKITVKTAFPESVDPASDIQIAVAHWDAGQDVLAYNPMESQAGALVFEGSVSDWPKGQQYKLNINFKEQGWIWEKGGNRDLPFDGKATVEVETWESEPWNPIPGGNATFVISIDGSCYEGMTPIFTGNFAEESWGDSQRTMTAAGGEGMFQWTGDYPDNFEFKVILRNAEGENTIWLGPAEGNWKVAREGETFERSATCPE